jgi:Fe-S cluster assembly ATP-binding protein
MLKIQNLNVKTDDKEILNNINFEALDDQIHVIMGPNGTGKSTLSKVILGNRLNYKVSGNIYFDNIDITNKSTSDIAKLGIFFLMQNPTEISGVTNAEMLRLALKEKGIEENIFAFNKRLNAVCEKLNIDKSFIHKNINENMSGGEKKKNELLQLYVLEPKLIILDELDSGLDIDSLKTLSNALLEYKKESKCTIIIITHHLNILNYLKPDKVHILNNGTFIASGDIKLAKQIEENGFKGTFDIDGDKINE